MAVPGAPATRASRWPLLRESAPPASGRYLARGRALPLAEAAAALAAVLLFLPATRYGFVFDDLGLISPDGWPARPGASLPYRPLRWASYLVDSWLGGSAAVYHLDNVLLHGAVAALVVALARRLGAGPLAALAGGLLLAFHPLAVEAAAYVAGRRDLLAVAAGLVALLAMHAGRAGTAALLLVTSTAAKESGLVFAAPLLAMAAARWPGVSRGPAVALLLAAVAASVVVALAYGAVGPWTLPATAAGAAFPGLVAMHYLTGFLGLRAYAPDYPALMDLALQLRAGDGPLLLAGLAATAVIVAFALWSIVRLRASATAAAGDVRETGRIDPEAAAASVRIPATANDERALAFTFAWIAAVVLALASGGAMHEPGVDRHAYLLLPAAGVALALLLHHARGALHGTRGVCASAAVVLLLASAAMASRGQMQAWSSEEALWSHAASQPVVSSRARANLAKVLAAKGDLRGARLHLDAALLREPGEASLFLARAAVHCASGRRVKARADLDRARVLGAADETVAALAADCPLPRLAQVLRGAPSGPDESSPLPGGSENAP